MAVKFMSELWMKPFGPRCWIVREDFVCNVDGETIIVPAGFVTDLASVPRGLWNIIPPFGLWSYAAVMHDYLYSGVCADRRFADAALYDGCIEMGVSRWRAFTIWAAVRLFGWMAFRPLANKD